jgi:hypothetical protein
MTLLNLNEFLPKISFFLGYLFSYYFNNQKPDNNLNDKVSHHIFLHSYNNKLSAKLSIEQIKRDLFPYKK